MRKSFTLILMVLAVASVAMSQGGPCRNCTPSRQAEWDRAALRAEHEKEVAAHNAWPTRPKHPDFGVGRRRTFTTLDVRFPVTNETGKKIKQITWECALIDLKTRNTVGNYTLVTRKGIAPHKSAILRAKVTVSLLPFYGPKVVPADQINQVKYELPEVVQAEQVNKIKEIQYSDGSVGHP